MSSIGIDREKHPGKSDAEIAEASAQHYGHVVIVRHKDDADERFR